MNTQFATLLVVVTALALHARAFAEDYDQHSDTRSQTPAGQADHVSMDYGIADQATMDHSGVDHASMRHDQMDSTSDTTGLPREPIPPLTDADRAAAFPELHEHASHAPGVVGLVQLDRLETWDGGDGTGLLWDARGWFGGDLDKLWVRTEGERVDDSTEAADVELLYGRAISPWWELLAGVRHDFDRGASQSWTAIGITGVAPQKFEIVATAYVGDSGRTALRLEAEYELLLTNRLIAQPLLELNLLGKEDADRGLGSGLTVAEIGIRLRYEVTRQFAPYVGVVYERAYGETADFRRSDGEDVDDTRVVAGVRAWF
jgi:copper resistance protein B